MENCIATREYELNLDKKITVYIGKPFLYKGDYRCDLEIVGFEKKIESYAIGSDGVQAIVLALTKIGTLLYTSEEYSNGKLTLFESSNLDIPYPSSIADLVKV
jgi:hypothetical protein